MRTLNSSNQPSGHDCETVATQIAIVPETTSQVELSLYICLRIVDSVLSSEEGIPDETPCSDGCNGARWSFRTSCEIHDDSNDECNYGGLTDCVFIFTHVANHTSVQMGGRPTRGRTPDVAQKNGDYVSESNGATSLCAVTARSSARCCA